jgi:tetratricopeptide (TPR) repeat protein
MKEHMERFPARLPPDLKKALADKAESLPGTSMNDLVVLAVRHVVEGTDLIVRPSGVVDAHEDLVVFTIEGEIGPAKGIARHYVDTGQHNLGALLYWVAARMQSDPRVAATELVRSADQIRKRSRPIAKALLRAALEHNPASDVAKNRLGQLLYFEGDYEGAVELLDRVREDDNYAKLFYGWATLERAAGNRSEMMRARDEIVVALRRWALGQRSPESREKWLDQVARLKACGSDFEQAVEDLVAYANDNASWTPIVTSEIKPPSQTTTSETELEELSGEG